MIYKIVCTVFFLSVGVMCVVAMPALIATSAGFATGYALGGGAALSLYSAVTVWTVPS